ncbi:MAG: oligosaccharide flippase family protein [Solirubrobacteraceae bacterium]|nr:oligosaccharide flippase family protein [Solirubrobacteraceae bacterium]
MAEPPIAAPNAPRSTLLQGSLMRFASDGSGVLLGLVSTIVTARVLGPAGRGTLAALTFVTLLVAQCSTLGLGDAAVVRIGQAKASVQEALSSSLVAVILASLAGAVVVFLYAVAQLPVDDPGIRAAVAVGCATVVVTAVGQLLLFVVYATQRVVAVSVLTMVMSTTAAAGIVVFVAVLDLDVFGGVLAGLVAASVGFGAAATMLCRARLRPRPRAAEGYLRPALHYGVRTQLANVLAYSSARLDLLFVYALASEAEAGIYSVALTLGTITGFVAVGLSFASFPRMAAMGDREALALTAQMTRIAVILGLALATILALGLSTLIAVLLGDDWNDVLAPGIVLLAANVLWGAQWLLSRALASRGDPGLLVRSFSLNLAVMVAADAILIPAAGAVGAAAGALVAAVAGLALCLRTYHRRGLAPAALVPRRADVRTLRRIAGRLAARLRPRSR